jgi:hypothetical protein
MLNPELECTQTILIISTHSKIGGCNNDRNICIYLHFLVPSPSPDISSHHRGFRDWFRSKTLRWTFEVGGMLPKVFNPASGLERRWILLFLWAREYRQPHEWFYDIVSRILS